MTRLKRTMEQTMDQSQTQGGEADVIRPRTKKRTLQDVGQSMNETLIELCRANHVKLAKSLADAYDLELMLMYHNYEFYRVAAAEGHTRLLNAFHSRLYNVLEDTMLNMEQEWEITKKETREKKIFNEYVSCKKPRYFRYLAFEEACRYGHLETAQFIHEAIRHDHGNLIGKNTHCQCSRGSGFVLLTSDHQDTDHAVFAWGEEVDVLFHEKGKQVALTECQDATKRQAICDWIDTLDESDHYIPPFKERIEYHPKQEWKCNCKHVMANDNAFD